MIDAYTIRPATTEDLPAVWGVLREAIDWLRSRGSDQWSTWRTWEGPDGKVTRAVEQGHLWLLFAPGDPNPIGTITVEPQGDPDFWTDDELADSAWYLSKLAVRRDHAGQELGALLLAWASDRAHQAGIRWVRLDAWRSNPDLHRYYADRGWHFVRDAATPQRQSGALFQIQARPTPITDQARIQEATL